MPPAGRAISSRSSQATTSPRTMAARVRASGRHGDRRWESSSAPFARRPRPAITRSPTDAHHRSEGVGRRARPGGAADHRDALVPCHPRRTERPRAGRVAMRVADDVGVRSSPGLALGVRRWIDLVVLEVRRNPDRHGLALRPNDLPPAAVRQVIVKPRVLRALVHLRASSHSITACTGSTSAYLSCRSVRLA